MRDFTSLTMSYAQLMAVHVIALAFLPTTNAQYGTIRRPQQYYFWQPYSQSKGTTAPPQWPEANSYSRQRTEDIYAEVSRRLQAFNRGDQQPGRGSWPRVRGQITDRQVPSVSAVRFPGQRIEPAQSVNLGFPRYHPAYDPEAGSDPNPGTSGNDEIQQRRPNMIQAPRDPDVSDRSRQAQNGFLNQLINGPSFWDKIELDDKRGQIPVTTTTTPPPPTTRPPPPPRVDPNFFNPDGSTNRRRLGMISPPVEPDTVRDRQGGNTAYDLFWSIMGSNFFTDTAAGARGRSREGNVPRPKAPQTVVNISETLGDHPPMYDKPFVGIPEDFLSTDSSQGAQPSRGRLPGTAPHRDAIQKRNSDEAAAARARNGPLNTEGKVSNSEVFSGTLQSTDTKLDGVNGQTPTTKLVVISEGEEIRARKRRQANPLSNDGVSCQTPEAFPVCQFYPSCFQEFHNTCISRDSFIGDDVSSFCSDLNLLARDTDTVELRTYLTDVIDCMDTSLLEARENPSCDVFTDHLSQVLLMEDNNNCLVRNVDKFCDMVKTPHARYALAGVFSEPKGREVFLLKLLRRLGNYAHSLCQGPGVTIFLLDLIHSVMHSNTTYTLLNGQPMPVFDLS